MLILTPILLISAFFGFADIRPTTLEGLISISDRIVVGKIRTVKTAVSDFRIAEVEVKKTLKGSGGVQTLYYQISDKSLEDTSDANVREEVVLFLRQPRYKPPSEYPTYIRTITHGEPLYYLSHAGRGRLVPTSIKGISYVYFRRDGSISVPDALPVKWGSDRQDPNLGLIPLPDLIDFIEKYLTQKSDKGDTMAQRPNKM